MPGGGMPESMEKGAFLERLDSLLKDFARRQKALQDLQKLKPDDLGLSAQLAALGTRYGLFVTPDEEKHFREDWLNKWWPSAQPIAPIIRQGLITAIEVASGAPGTPRAGQPQLPVDCYWACHPGHTGGPETSEAAGTEAVDSVVMWSAQQVTIVVHTPDPPIPDGLHTNTEPIFVVRWNAKKDKIVVARP